METRIRRDGLIRIPPKLAEALELYPESKITMEKDGDALVIRKVAMADDPFAKAAAGPDMSALDRIREKQKEDTDKARDRFEELLKDPPEVKPEDNPDLWR